MRRPEFLPGYPPVHGRIGLDGFVPLDLMTFPATAAGFEALVGVSGATPSHIYLCQDASGDLTDSIGGANAVAEGTAQYQYAMPPVGVGVRRREAGPTDWTAAISNVANPVMAVLSVFRCDGTLPADGYIGLCHSTTGIGAGFHCYLEQTNGQLYVNANGGPNSAATATDHSDGNWHYGLVYVNATTGDTGVKSDIAVATGGGSGWSPVSTALVLGGRLGGSTATYIQYRCWYVFLGAAATAIWNDRANLDTNWWKL